MCYSAEVSLGTFVFVALGAIVLWQRNDTLDRPIGLLLLVVALMQLVEFFLWKNLDCGPANRFWTHMIPVALLLQPILSLWIVWQWKAGWGPYYKELLILTSAISVPVLAQFWRALNSCTKLDEYGHLVWPKDAYDISPLGTTLYTLVNSYINITLKDPVYAGLMIAFYHLSDRQSQAMYPKSWPSVWCQFANFLMCIALARPYLPGRNLVT